MIAPTLSLIYPFTLLASNSWLLTPDSRLATRYSLLLKHFQHTLGHQKTARDVNSTNENGDRS